MLEKSTVISNYKNIISIKNSGFKNTRKDDLMLNPVTLNSDLSGNLPQKQEVRQPKLAFVVFL